MHRKLILVGTVALLVTLSLIWIYHSSWFSSASTDSQTTFARDNGDLGKEPASDSFFQSEIHSVVIREFGRGGSFAGDVESGETREMTRIASNGFAAYSGQLEPREIQALMVQQGWEVGDDWQSDPNSAPKRWRDWHDAVVGEPDWQKIEIDRVIRNGKPLPRTASLTQSVQSYNKAIGPAVAGGGLANLDVYEVRVPVTLNMNGSTFNAKLGIQVAKSGPAGRWRILGVALRDMPNEVRFSPPPLN